MVMVSTKCKIIWGSEDIVGECVMGLVFERHVRAVCKWAYNPKCVTPIGDETRHKMCQLSWRKPI